jgi:hypothetical protein
LHSMRCLDVRLSRSAVQYHRLTGENQTLKLRILSIKFTCERLSGAEYPRASAANAPAASSKSPYRECPRGTHSWPTPASTRRRTRDGDLRFNANHQGCAQPVYLLCIFAWS